MEASLARRRELSGQQHVTTIRNKTHSVHQTCCKSPQHKKARWVTLFLAKQFHKVCMYVSKHHCVSYTIYKACSGVCWPRTHTDASGVCWPRTHREASGVCWSHMHTQTPVGCAGLARTERPVGCAGPTCIHRGQWDVLATHAHAEASGGC